MAGSERTSIKLGVHDIIMNNEILRNIPSKMGYVTSQAELANYVNEDPGYMAIQYGLKHMWQLKPDKTWEPIV